MPISHMAPSRAGESRENLTKLPGHETSGVASPLREEGAEFGVRNVLPLLRDVLVAVRRLGQRQAPGTGGRRNFDFVAIRHLDAVPLIGNGDVFASAHAVAGEAFGFERLLEEDGLKAVTPPADFAVDPALGRRGMESGRRNVVKLHSVREAKFPKDRHQPSSLDAS